jgi:hypothetical protein
LINKKPQKAACTRQPCAADSVDKKLPSTMSLYPMVSFSSKNGAYWLFFGGLSPTTFSFFFLFSFLF